MTTVTGQWREVSPDEVTAWGMRKVVAGYEGWTYEKEVVTTLVVITFADGSQLRVTFENGRVYSERTSDPDRLTFEVRDAR